jgi:hypothetical protein
MVDIVLQLLLIDALVFHSQLTNQERAEWSGSSMTQKKRGKNTLKVLIMTYEVGAVGLNLHEACDRVATTSIGRSRPQESQQAGRVCRVSISR